MKILKLSTTGPHEVLEVSEEEGLNLMAHRKAYRFIPSIERRFKGQYVERSSPSA